MIAVQFELLLRVKTLDCWSTGCDKSVTFIACTKTISTLFRYILIFCYVYFNQLHILMPRFN